GNFNSLVIPFPMTSNFIPTHDEQAGSVPQLDEAIVKDHSVSSMLPEIPIPDLKLDFSDIIGPTSAEEEKVQKRASDVLKLTEKNEKLKAELKAMTDRIEAAERRKIQLTTKEQKIAEELSQES
ncbi:hypothetical protein K443DRAFT_84473, partial [Laccaria amethystina LaAM-08-1]